MNPQDYHDKQVRTMIVRPQEFLGIEGIIMSTCESTLFNRNRRISGQPDALVFDPSTRTLYNIEYKSYDNRKQRRRAEDQLNKSKYFLNKIFKEYRIINLYVHDNFEIEAI